MKVICIVDVDPGCNLQKTEIVRAWPRPKETADIGRYTLTEEFKRAWSLIVPPSWTVLPDGRVFLNDQINDGTIWFPNDVLENVENE